MEVFASASPALAELRQPTHKPSLCSLAVVKRLNTTVDCLQHPGIPLVTDKPFDAVGLHWTHNAPLFS